MLTQVRVSVYNKGKEKAWFQFNGKGSSATDFFSPDNLKSSSYSDTSSDSGEYNYFSIEGYILHARGRCTARKTA